MSGLAFLKQLVLGQVIGYDLARDSLRNGGDRYEIVSLGFRLKIEKRF